MSGYEAVLFDNDGVLVEPPLRESQVAAIRAALREVGLEDVDTTDVETLRGGVYPDDLEALCARRGLDPVEVWDARERHDEESQLADFREGVRAPYDDVSALEDLDGACACGVVSNNHHSTVAFVLEFFELEAHFEVHYGREMTIESLERKKPHPHYLERALSDLAVDPAEALYVGDSESDVVAAARAGADSVFLRREHWRDRSLSVEPTYEAGTLHDVLALVEER